MRKFLLGALVLLGVWLLALLIHFVLWLLFSNWVTGYLTLLSPIIIGGYYLFRKETNV